jgi:hypothetical protein
MEWLNGPEEHNMEVDLGYQPRMELISSAPSIQATFEDIDIETNLPKKFPLYKKPTKQLTHETYKKFINGIRWQEEIPLEKAIENLEKSFFPFKEVNYFFQIFILKD